MIKTLGKVKSGLGTPKETMSRKVGLQNIPNEEKRDKIENKILKIEQETWRKHWDSLTCMELEPQK